MDRAVGLGYLIRDHPGELIFAGSSFSITQTVLEVELQAAWKWLSIVVEGSRFKRIWIEGDSSTVVKLIFLSSKEGSAKMTHHLNHPLLGDILGYCIQLDGFVVSRINKEINRTGNGPA